MLYTPHDPFFLWGSVLRRTAASKGRAVRIRGRRLLIFLKLVNGTFELYSTPVLGLKKKDVFLYRINLNESRARAKGGAMTQKI